MYHSLENDDHQNEYLIKCCVIGETLTGKTSLIQSLIGDDKNKVEKTIGVDFVHHVIKSSNPCTIFRLQIWDCAGSFEFENVIESYLKNTAIYFIVFDQSRLETLQACIKWLEKIRNQTCIRILVGNKSDVGHDDFTPLITRMKHDYNIDFFESISAKTDSNITETFIRAVQLLSTTIVHQCQTGPTEVQYQYYPPGVRHQCPIGLPRVQCQTNKFPCCRWV